MPDITTGPDASGDAAPDYERKYNGLQAAFQKRTNEFVAREQAWETERSGYEARLARLAEFEARESAAQEEAEAEAQYQALRERFEPEPPTPFRHNGARTMGRREPSADEMVMSLDKIVGKTSDRENWSLS